MTKYYEDKDGNLFSDLTEEQQVDFNATEITDARPSENHIRDGQGGWVEHIPEITDAMKKDAMLQSIFELGTDEVLDGIKQLMNMPSEITTLKSRIAELESVEVVTAIANPITVAGEYSLLVDGYDNEYSKWSSWDNLHVYFSTNTMGVDHHIGTFSLADFATYDGSTNGWISETNAKYIMHGEGGYVITRVPGNNFKIRVVMIGAGRIEKVKLSKR